MNPVTSDGARCGWDGMPPEINHPIENMHARARARSTWLITCHAIFCGALWLWAWAARPCWILNQVYVEDIKNIYSGPVPKLIESEIINRGHNTITTIFLLLYTPYINSLNNSMYHWKTWTVNNRTEIIEFTLKISFSIFYMQNHQRWLQQNKVIHVVC